MSVAVFVQTPPEYQAWHQTILAACQAILAQLQIDQGTMSVVLIDEQEIRRINLEFAGADYATDVLSFPDGELDPDTGFPYLGDVLIALPVAQEQADEKGHTLIEELSLLAIHGTLHLVGYDHADQESKARMWSHQASALHLLGMSEIAGDID